MPVHRHRSGAETSIPGFQERLWGISQPSRRWPLRVRALARLRRPWLDAALAIGADPASSPYLERRAAALGSRGNRNRLARAFRRRRELAGGRVDPRDPRIAPDPQEVHIALSQLLELERLLLAPGPVYCRGIAMAWQVITEGAGPLYAPRRRGELRERLEAVLAALRGAQ